jgi:hypothetical protein
MARTFPRIDVRQWVVLEDFNTNPYIQYLINDPSTAAECRAHYQIVQQEIANGNLPSKDQFYDELQAFFDKDRKHADKDKLMPRQQRIDAITAELRAHGTEAPANYSGKSGKQSVKAQWKFHVARNYEMDQFGNVYGRKDGKKGKELTITQPLEEQYWRFCWAHAMTNKGKEHGGRDTTYEHFMIAKALQKDFVMRIIKNQCPGCNPRIRKCDASDVVKKSNPDNNLGGQGTKGLLKRKIKEEHNDEDGEPVDRAPKRTRMVRRNTQPTLVQQQNAADLDQSFQNHVQVHNPILLKERQRVSPELREHWMNNERRPMAQEPYEYAIQDHHRTQKAEQSKQSQSQDVPQRPGHDMFNNSSQTGFAQGKYAPQNEFASRAYMPPGMGYTQNQNSPNEEDAPYEVDTDFHPTTQNDHTTDQQPENSNASQSLRQSQNTLLNFIDNVVMHPGSEEQFYAGMEAALATSRGTVQEPRVQDAEQSQTSSASQTLGQFPGTNLDCIDLVLTMINAEEDAATATANDADSEEGRLSQSWLNDMDWDVADRDSGAYLGQYSSSFDESFFEH